MLGLVGFGHEKGHVPAQDLAGGVLEQPLGGRVERLDPTGLGDRDDGVDGRVEDGLQPGLPPARVAAVTSFDAISL